MNGESGLLARRSASSIGTGDVLASSSFSGANTCEPSGAWNDCEGVNDVDGVADVGVFAPPDGRSCDGGGVIDTDGTGVGEVSVASTTGTGTGTGAEPDPVLSEPVF